MAEELSAAAVTLLQYRNKSGDGRQILEQSRELKRRLGGSVTLIMDDRADLCLVADFDGVHVGQEDLSPASARKVIGDRLCLGVSTHNPEQVAEADKTSADYIAIGPVFSTASKFNPGPVIGLEGAQGPRFPDAFETDDWTRIELARRRKHRPNGNIVSGCLIGFRNLLRVVGGDAEAQSIADHFSGAGWPILLSNVYTIKVGY